jgi:aspartate carbamoyltransferase catalytic subunit
MFPERFNCIRGLDSRALCSLLTLSFKIKSNPESYAGVLKGKTILQFFVENSTRTRLSFESATRKLGGLNLSFSASTSSISKGETLTDTVNVIRQYGVDGIVVRHRSMGAPDLLADATGLPVINAGDGAHEHPTQALLDAFTLGSRWNLNFKDPDCFRGKKIMILGDLRHSRVARSNIHFLGALGAEIHLCAPATLMIPDLSLFPEVTVHSFPDEILSEMDAVMTLRIQMERQNQGVIPSLTEYREFWGLTVERAKQMKAGSVILHPGPMNRGVEIDSEIADSEASLILKQVENGVFARMAVLASVVGKVDS